jgi:hypothetical protein
MQSLLHIKMKKYEIWWYERGYTKLKLKTSMMFMDAIHVHAKEGRKHGKVEGDITSEINDCLLAVHESWCHVKPPPPCIE